jgi:hypothetical protein
MAIGEAQLGRVYSDFIRQLFPKLQRLALKVEKSLLFR